MYKRVWEDTAVIIKFIDDNLTCKEFPTDLRQVDRGLAALADDFAILVRSGCNDDTEKKLQNHLLWKLASSRVIELHLIGAKNQIALKKLEYVAENSALMHKFSDRCWMHGKEDVLTYFYACERLGSSPKTGYSPGGYQRAEYEWVNHELFRVENIMQTLCYNCCGFEKRNDLRPNIRTIALALLFANENDSTKTNIFNIIDGTAEMDEKTAQIEVGKLPHWVEFNREVKSAVENMTNAWKNAKIVHANALKPSEAKSAT